MPAEGVVHVPLEHFTAAIRAARRVGQLVSLRDLVARHIGGRTTAGLVAVTMDDAYASWLGEAADFVCREAVPLTVFIVTDAAAVGARYWWDRIDDLFARVSREQWRSFENACGLTEDYREGQPAHYGPLRPFRQWMLAVRGGRWPQALESLLSTLEEKTGTQTLHRSMTFEELARFAALPSVDVGVHTRSHPVLPLLPEAELTQEISGAYGALYERFPNAVPILAIPFGLFDKRTLRAARESGMMASLTLAGTTLRRSQGRDDLPRFCVSRGESPLRLQLRLVGVLEWFRGWGAATPSRYPELPSPTT